MSKSEVDQDAAFRRIESMVTTSDVAQARKAHNGGLLGAADGQMCTELDAEKSPRAQGKQLMRSGERQSCDQPTQDIRLLSVQLKWLRDAPQCSHTPPLIQLLPANLLPVHSCAPL